MGRKSPEETFGVGLREKCKIFQKKVQKNLQVKKKVVPLQPV